MCNEEKIKTKSPGEIPEAEEVTVWVLRLIFPVSRPLIKTNMGLTFELFAFAATAVRQLELRGLAGLPAPLWRLRLGLRRLLPRQRPLLRLGWTQLLSLLSHREKVDGYSSFRVCRFIWSTHESNLKICEKIDTFHIFWLEMRWWCPSSRTCCCCCWSVRKLMMQRQMEAEL